jgi:hypothetical protein
MTNNGLILKKLKTILVYYISLIIVFAGISTIMYLYLNSFLDILNMPEWGVYIVLNLFVSIVAGITIIVGIASVKSFKHTLIGLTGMLMLLDIYKTMHLLFITGSIKSVFTIAFLVLIIHSYIFYSILRGFYITKT